MEAQATISRVRTRQAEIIAAHQAVTFCQNQSQRRFNHICTQCDVIVKSSEYMNKDTANRNELCLNCGIEDASKVDCEGDRNGNKYLSSYDVITTATPCVSRPGLPARPIIWMISDLGMRSYPLEPPRQQLVPLMMTRWAGRLSPCASVDVEHKMRILPARKSCSTTLRSSRYHAYHRRRDSCSSELVRFGPVVYCIIPAGNPAW